MPVPWFQESASLRLRLSHSYSATHLWLPTRSPGMSKPKLAIVVGSIRPNRFADHPAQWITEIAKQRGDFDVELIDLKDYPLPLFAETSSPAYGASKDEVAQRWQRKVAEFDAYVFTAAEYNRGPTAALKN